MQNDNIQSNPPAPVTTGVSDDSQPVAIAVQNLVKEYRVGRQKVRAVNDISLEIHKGEFVALTGASGSGKSTLLQLMGGLDRPSSGLVFINNQQLGKLSDSKLSTFRNKTVGFVFQFFYLQPFLTLERNIEVAAMPNRMKKSTRKERIKHLAERVGLSERLSHLPKELSGGQIQRSAIARALLNQPSIILADEPTGNLDSKNSQEIIALFKSLRDELGATIVIATHDQAIAAQADRVISIRDGAIA